MKPEEIASKLQEKFGDKILEVNIEGLETHDAEARVEPSAMAEVAQYCRDELGFNYLACLSGVDYMDKKKTTDDLGVVYHLKSFDDPTHEFCLKVRLPRDDPRVPTVSHLWSTADWHEREAWDLVGTVFDGHPNLTRILCAEDWVGHALQKDYVSPDTYHGIKNNVV